MACELPPRVRGMPSPAGADRAVLPASARVAPRRAPRRLARAARAARHPPGRRQADPHAGIPGRIHLPVQPPTLTRHRDALLPATRPGRPSRAAHIPLARRRTWLRTPRPGRHHRPANASVPPLPTASPSIVRGARPLGSTPRTSPHSDGGPFSVTAPSSGYGQRCTQDTLPSIGVSP